VQTIRGENAGTGIPVSVVIDVQAGLMVTAAAIDEQRPDALGAH
jgi:hypothetical protein